MSAMKKGPDVLGAEAGTAAIESAAEFVNDLYNSDGSGDPAPAEEIAAPAPEKPADDGDTGFLGGFEAIDEAKEEPKPAPLPVKDEQDVPAHVVRKGEKAIETWKQMRAELDAANQKAADIERDRLLKDQEIEELRKKLETAPPESEIKELKEKLQAAEDYVGRMDITQSKKFQEDYDKPLTETFGKVVRAFMKAGHEQAQAVELARKVFRPGMADPAKLEQALPDEQAVVIGAVSSLLEDREVYAQKREEALQNWKQTAEAVRMEEQRRASTEIGQQLTRVSEQAFDAVSKDGSWLYQRGQDPKWNEGVEARKNAAVGYIRAGKPEDLARLVFEGIAAPTYRRGYEKLRAKYDELLAKHEALANRGRPGLTQHAPAPGTPSREVAAPASANEFIDQVWSEE